MGLKANACHHRTATARYKRFFPRAVATSFLPSAGYDWMRSSTLGSTCTARVPGLQRYDPHEDALLWVLHAGTTHQWNLKAAPMGESASLTWPPVRPSAVQPTAKQGGLLIPVQERPVWHERTR